MRVIAGELKGRRILSPRGRDVRPTYDRVRESLFGILEPDIPGSLVLDLFAGSGSLGIEALSRGATEVVFVERSTAVLRVLEENITALGLEDRSFVLKGDALRLARDRRIPRAPFDLVFVDPPYSSGDAGRSLVLLPPLLAPGALVVVEQAATPRRSRRDAVGPGPTDEPAGLIETRRRRYGTTELVFYRPTDGSEDREAS